MSDDIVDQLRIRHLQQACSDGESVYSQGADESERLREELGDLEAYADLAYADATRAEDEVTYWKARARRAEVDADRLAVNLSRMPCACTWRSYGVIGYRCTKCVALDLHDREVEAQ